MKSKSKGFFHFGRQPKEESEILHAHAHYGRKNSNSQSQGHTVALQADLRQMNNQHYECWIWDQSSRENPDEMIQELREADQK